MTIEALEQFRGRLATDAALQKACMDAINGGKMDEFVALGRSLGFEFSAEDVARAREDAELTDFELELVAGGFVTQGQLKDA